MDDLIQIMMHRTWFDVYHNTVMYQNSYLITYSSFPGHVVNLLCSSCGFISKMGWNAVLNFQKEMIR